MKVKWSSRFVVMALAVAIASGVVMPKKSHAYLALGGAKEWSDWWDTNGPLGNTLFIVLCGATLPFCLLDEKGSDSEISRESLLEQGYSQSEVSNLVMNQNLLASDLAHKNFSLQIKKNDNRQVLRHEILSVSPHISEEYMEFLFEMKAIK
jgi:hypothetical protein